MLLLCTGEERKRRVDCSGRGSRRKGVGCCCQRRYISVAAVACPVATIAFSVAALVVALCVSWCISVAAQASKRCCGQVRYISVAALLQLLHALLQLKRVRGVVAKSGISRTKPLSYSLSLTATTYTSMLLTKRLSC